MRMHEESQPEIFPEWIVALNYRSTGLLQN